MAPRDELSALRPVLDALKALGVDHSIGGSVASSLHGGARGTLDVDVVADLRPAHVQPLVSRLAAAYYIEVDAVRRAVDRRGSFSAIHLATMYKIDVLVMRDRPYDREARRRVVRERLSEAQPVEDAVAAPEDVILSKLEWYRAGGEISERQWLDVLGVIQVQHERLEAGYLRRWAAELEVLDLLERAWEEATT